MSYCYNCFYDHSGAGPCPRCGYDPAADAGKFPQALPHGTILAGQFITGRVLGQGGFGITYLALDNRSGDRVALKEFLPDTIAGRSAGTLAVTAHSGDRGQQFQYGLDCFLDEARTLAKFIGNPHIVGVRSYFQENGTAYFTMDYIEGTSFKAYLRERGGRIGWEEAVRLLLPVMDALEAVHREGLVHRDVTPDNIYITSDGQVKLLDFGAARYSLGDRSRSLDVVLKPGYAPKEQYVRRGRQGPYTDVYSLSACFYAAITGYLPPESLERMEDDNLVPPSARRIKLPIALEDAILKALEVQPQNRYQTMGEFAAAVRSVTAEDRREPVTPGPVVIDISAGYPHNVSEMPPAPVYAAPPAWKTVSAPVAVQEPAPEEAAPEEPASDPDPLPGVKNPRTWMFTPVYIGCAAVVFAILAFVVYKYVGLLNSFNEVSGPGFHALEQEIARRQLMKEIMLAACGMAVVACPAMLEMLRQSRRKREPYFQKGLWLHRQGNGREARLWFKMAANMGHERARAYAKGAPVADEPAPASEAPARMNGQDRLIAVCAAAALAGALIIFVIATLIFGQDAGPDPTPTPSGGGGQKDVVSVITPGLPGTFSLGNTSGNLMGGGYVAERDGWTYYVDSEAAGDAWAIRRTNGRETSTLAVVDYGDLSHLNVADDWIYYLSTNGIYRVRTDGSAHESFLDAGGTWYRFLLAADDRFYAITVDYRDSVFYYDLVSVSRDGATETLVHGSGDDSLDGIAADADGIYYRAKDGFYRLSADGSESARLLEDEWGDSPLPNGYFCLEDGRIYFYSRSRQAICRVRTDGGGLEEIISGSPFGYYDFNASSLGLYYVAEDGIRRADLDGTNSTLLLGVEDAPQALRGSILNMGDLQVTPECLYFQIYEWWEDYDVPYYMTLYRIPTAGGAAERLTPERELPAESES